jgi:hypothetical protein
VFAYRQYFGTPYSIRNLWFAISMNLTSGPMDTKRLVQILAEDGDEDQDRRVVRRSPSCLPPRRGMNAVSSGLVCPPCSCLQRWCVPSNLGVRVMTSVVPSATQPAILGCEEHEMRVIRGHWANPCARDSLLCPSRGVSVYISISAETACSRATLCKLTS